MTALDPRIDGGPALPVRDADVVTSRLHIPGAGTLAFHRDRASSALIGISGGGRDYLVVDRSGTWWWAGICTTREERLVDATRHPECALACVSDTGFSGTDHACGHAFDVPGQRVPPDGVSGDGRLQGMVRHVTTPTDSWTEYYRWEGGALVEVDGTVIRRDDRGRVVACLPGGADPAPAPHRWTYAHDDVGVLAVDGPFGHRLIARTADGRVRSVRQDGVQTDLAYDDDGVRRAPGRPLHDHVDEAGRCWARRDADGRVRHLYLWDGNRCLARIDGPVGAALAQVYSLDPSATPVRIITPQGGVRVPRDAFGEGLLAHRGVPGLFGGQVHGGLVHLPLRRLDPVAGAFCEPDPFHGGDDDIRRQVGTNLTGSPRTYDGPIPTEPDPRSAYEVCRGDPVGRADPTGGVSAGLIISDLTWSFQNNILSFFGIDWWFNLFASLIVKPFSGIGDGIDYEFFSSTGLKGSDRHGGFGVRRGGIINAITGGRAFTTQHIVWSPDREYAELEHGEVIDPGGAFTPTHYGTILSITPDGHDPVLLSGMRSSVAGWRNVGGSSTPLDGNGNPLRHVDGGHVVVNANGLADWTRHGGVGVAVAPGTLTPWFPSGGIHLDDPLTNTRGDLPCPIVELRAGAVAIGDLEDRTFLTAPTVTGLSAGHRVVVADGTGLALADVVAVVPSGVRQRVQLDVELTGLSTTGLTMTRVAAAGAPANHPAGAVANSLDVHGTAATYAAADLVQVSSAAAPPDVTVGRIDRVEAQLPLDRALPAGFGGPISVALGTISPAAVPVTVNGADLDFGSAARPGIGSTGLVSGGGVDIAVRIDGHGAGSLATIDDVIPPAIAGAPVVTFRSILAGTAMGIRSDPAEVPAVLTYTPVVAGAAPDGSGTTTVVHCQSGTIAHARIVTGAPVHDVIVIDRAIAGAGPFDVQRLTPDGSTASGLTRTEVVGLVVDDPGRFSAAPAVYLTKVGGEPPTPAVASLAGVNVVAGAVSTTPASPVPDLEVGRPVLAGARAAVIRRIRATVPLGAAVNLSADGLRLVGLAPTGHAHQGAVLATDRVAARPTIDVAGTTVAVPFPRFAVGDLVAVTDAGTTTWHRVTASANGALTLAGGPGLTPGNAVTVQHVVTTDPATGGPFLGIDGTRAGTGATTTVTFSVWTADALDPATVGPVAIIDGDLTHPVVIAAGAQPLEVQFSEAFDATGIDVAVMASHLDDQFITSLARDGGVLLLAGPIGTLQTAPGETLVAVAMEPVGDTRSATIGPGTLLVPEGEGTEVDRSQSLTDHELTHTLQYARWGPLWFNAFPMLLMELPGILATDTELPEYSAFLDGTLQPGTDDRWDLTIPNSGGVAITAGDELQVVQGARRTRFTVHAVSGTTVQLRDPGSGAAPTGPVSVRKLQRNSVFDTFYAIFDTMTHGGLVNLLAGSTWGGIFWLIGKAFYGLGRAIGGTGELYPATVQAGGGALTLTNSADTTHIRESGQVVVRQGDSTVVRTMTRSDLVIVLDQAVAFTGDVRVAMYDTHDPGSAFDWYDYHPATVDPANPFVVEVAGGGLSLTPEDRVVVLYRDQTPKKTDVVAVSGTTVELLDPIGIIDDERSLRIARIGASDPLGNADSAAMVEMGMGWMKWIFDPYGQIEYAVNPSQDWARWLLRVMRWILGTQNFSLLPFGYLWWGRLFPVRPEHVTEIEQEASEESGDLYSPLGRLYGERTADGYARYQMVVGDIARYRLWSFFRGESYVQRRQLDAPGVHQQNVVTTAPDATGAADNRTVLRQLIRIMPDQAGGGPAGAPNAGQQAGAAAGEPGRAVAEAFTVRAADPGLVADGPAVPGPPPSPDPFGFRPADLGHVPEPPRNQRMQSAYVAFTRAGNHRVTTINDWSFIRDGDGNLVAVPQLAVDAQDRENQELTFDVTATDVSVTVAGQVVDASTPGTSDVVTLIPFQQAGVTVTPNGARAYRLAVDDQAVTAVGVDGDARLVGIAPSPGVAVEVSRLHAASGGGYTAGGLAFAGMHLSRDVYIPVRRFTVTVVDTLVLRDAPTPTAAAVPTLARGDNAFLLVPAPINRVPVVTTIGGVAPASGDPDPISRADAPDATAFLGVGGAAFRLNFAASAATGLVVVTVRVGDGTGTADLTATFDLN